MAITPADIEKLTFSPSKHGYDTEEVDAFLDRLSGDVNAMLQKISELKGRLNSTEQQLAASQEQVSKLQNQLAMASRSQVPAVPISMPPQPQVSSMGATENQISRVLIIAQQSADKLVADARDNAEAIRNDADKKARELIRQALAEKQNELDEIDRLKASREDFRTAYKKLLQHFMDDADSVFPSLSDAEKSKVNDTAGAHQEHAYPAAPNPQAPISPAPMPAGRPGADSTLLSQSIGNVAPVTYPEVFGDLD